MKKVCRYTILKEYISNRQSVSGRKRNVTITQLDFSGERTTTFPGKGGISFTGYTGYPLFDAIFKRFV
jgi:hypothetical protein